jgi:hypothetical protein
MSRREPKKRPMRVLAFLAPPIRRDREATGQIPVRSNRLAGRDGPGRPLTRAKPLTSHDVPPCRQALALTKLDKT